MRGTLQRGAAALTVAGVVSLASPDEALAQFVVGVDVDYLGTVSFDDDTVTTNAGAFGWGPRLGFEIPIAFLYLRPEAGATFAHFDTHTDTRLYAGARVGLDTLISPAVYAHVGQGWYNVTSPSYQDLTWDVGAALDLRLKVVTLGAHVGLDTNPQVSPSWVNAGLHGELRF